MSERPRREGLVRVVGFVAGLVLVVACSDGGPDTSSDGAIDATSDAESGEGGPDVADDASDDVAEIGQDDAPDTVEDAAEDVDGSDEADGEARCGDGEVQAGEECDDGNDAPGDGREPGTCQFTCHDATDCEDVDACTSDSCEAVAGGRSCRHVVRVDDPCDDGDPCTTGDRCDDAGSCVGASDVCVCTNDADCVSYEDGEVCNGTLVCGAAGRCEVDPATVRDPGDSCDDGLFCNGVDTCVGSDPPTRACVHAGDACVGCDGCNEATDRCAVGLSDCLIDGACYMMYARDPANDCRWCNPSFSVTGWSDVPGRPFCDDADPCTVGETCLRGICAAPLRGAEVCDGADNDCDGSCDEGWPCCRGTLEACATIGGAPGFSACDDACSRGSCVYERTCSAEWCWDNPLPQGNDLVAVWNSGPGDVWAAGGSGTTVHWDGTTWTVPPSGTAVALWGIWGAASDDVWALALTLRGTAWANAVFRWDGVTWSAVAGPDTLLMRSIWGFDSTRVWLVGGNGSGILRHDR